MFIRESKTRRGRYAANVERELFELAAALHTGLGRDYIRAGRPDLAIDEANSARRALRRAREVAQ